MAPVRRSEPKTLGPFVERQVGGDDARAAFVALGDALEGNRSIQAVIHGIGQMV